jgi:predicted MFS family arabinose efflux permease
VADTVGFRAVFLGATLGGLTALALLVGLVRDPRHEGEARVAA